MPRLHDFEHFARVDRYGRVLTGHGQVEELAALASYVARVGDLIGELLHFGPAVAHEASFANGSLFTYRDDHGEIVGVKPHVRVSLAQIRARLAL